MTALEALKSNDVAIQRDAFEALKAEVFPICYRRLGTKFPQEIDDVVIESMQDVLKKVHGLKTDKELTNLAKSIAEKKAISRWRSLTTEKNGKGRFTSIDLLREEGLEPYTPSGEMSPNEDVFYAPPDATSHFHKLDTNDIQSILETLQQELKLEHKQAIHDFFIKDLSYAESEADPIF